ncbi:winged helix-turn-helix transcriptional regulator [Pseudonocardia spinosispora]|uniref:winged helix-turn-helix transcriptional regulator n=1 Tax=Pseudonocardia spinosispora TaxID=103441 RepID=UPI0003F5D7E6|nr:helix-turn-helix domain-containing protein [Pseudonocardia spinosispora]
MAGKRKYDDGCAVSHGLDLVGERWALLIVRELLLGPKRFTDLRGGLPGASADMLTQRLRELVESGVVEHRKLAPPSGAWVYELTEWGAELEPLVTLLGRWGSRSPGMRGDAPLGVDSLVLSLRALFDPRSAGGFEATIGLRLGEHEFRVRIEHGTIALSRAELSGSAVRLDTDVQTLSALLRAQRVLDEAIHAGDLVLTGDRAVAERFLRLFPLPTPAGSGATLRG